MKTEIRREHTRTITMEDESGNWHQVRVTTEYERRGDRLHTSAWKPARETYDCNGEPVMRISPNVWRMELQGTTLVPVEFP